MKMPKTSHGVLYVIAGGLYFHFRMSDEWYSEGESESDEETSGIKRSWIQERFRAGAKEDLPRGSHAPAGGDSTFMVHPVRSLGRGLAPSNRPAQEIGDYKGGHFMSSTQWDNPSEVLRHVTASYSSLVREEAVRESPVTDVKIDMVAAEVSRPVPEEAVESEVGDSQVLVVPSKDPGEVKKQGSTSRGHLWNNLHLQA